MNYPLAEAILSFTGAGRLDRELLAKTHQYAQNVRDIGGAEFRRRLDGVMAVYPNDVTSLQLNLLDSPVLRHGRFERLAVGVRQWRLGCSAAVAQVARQAKASSWPSTPGMTRLGFALPSPRSRAAR
jgi:hypothetical protein